MAGLPEDVRAPSDEGDERIAEMREAIVKLPEEMRETLELRLADELSYEEIAAVLEIPIGTVRSRLHNAVKKLREELKHE
jgi:RNA polymerase sigma-70 factor (ECF subfamily)